MKKLKIVVLILLISLCVSCGNNTNDNVEVQSNEETQVNVEEEVIDENHLEESSSHKITKMYDDLDKNKDKLKYNIEDKEVYFYETTNGFAGKGMLNEIPKLDDKKYGLILRSYTLSSELVPIDMRYNNALSYVEKVLPNDVKKEREKFDPDTGGIYVIYSSNKGNFVACLPSKITLIKNGKCIYDKEWVSGISYLKEIK